MQLPEICIHQKEFIANLLLIQGINMLSFFAFDLRIKAFVMYYLPGLLSGRTGVMSYQSWIPHLEELRKRLIISIAVLIAACIPVFIFYDFFFTWITSSVKQVLEEGANLLYASTVYEAFLVKLKFSLLTAFVLSFPVHVLNISVLYFPHSEKGKKYF